MAQGDNYQFGVAIEIKNHKFRRPTLFVSTVNSISIATDFALINNPFENSNKIIQVGDKLNASNSSDQAENKTIVAVTDPGGGQGATLTRIQVDSNFSLTYAALDPVIIKGTRLAGGWIRNDNLGTGVETNLVEPVSIKPNGGGASDDYAQEYRAGSTSALVSGIVNGLQQNLTPNKLQEFAYYRTGCQLKIDIDNISGSALFSMLLKDATSTITMETQRTDLLSWTRFVSSSGRFVRKAGSSPSLQCQLFTVTLPDNIIASVDDIFLEHAFGTTPAASVKSFINAGGGQFQITIYGEIGTGANQFDVITGDEIAVDDRTNFNLLIVSAASGSVVTATSFDGSASAIAADSRIQKKNNGFFTLADTPVQESISYDKVRTDRFSQLSDGSLKNFDPMSEGHKGERWRFSCRFLGISQAIFDGLQKLLRHQQNGSLINFHPFIDDLPHVLSGKMFITNYKKAFLFDLPSHDFTFKFEEMST